MLNTLILCFFEGENEPAVIFEAFDNFKAVLSKGIKHFVLSAFDNSACDVNAVICEEFANLRVELHNNVGNDICNNNIELAAHLVGQIALNCGESILTKTVLECVLFGSFDSEFVNVNAECRLCTEEKRCD